MRKQNRPNESVMTIANEFCVEIDRLLEHEERHIAEDVRFGLTIWLQSLLHLRHEDDPFLVYVEPYDGNPDVVPLAEAELLGIVRSDPSGVFAFERGHAARPGVVEVNGDVSIIVERLLEEYADKVPSEDAPSLSLATLDRARNRYEELTGKQWRPSGGGTVLGGHRFVDFVSAPSLQYAHAAEDAEGVRWLPERDGSAGEIIAWQDPREPARLQFKWLLSDGRPARPSSPIRFQAAGVDVGKIVFSEGYSDVLLESEAHVRSLLEPSERITIRLEVDDS